MEMPVDSHRSRETRDPPALELALLGPLVVRRDGQELALPGSRKTRALLAYLALAPHPVARSALCELLWDGPADPRGELRWCLSKLRSLLDRPGRPRLESRGDMIRLDLAGCAVDAHRLAAAVDRGLEDLAPAALWALDGHFRGELLAGLELDRNPAFGAWLTGQRRRFRGIRMALLERLAAVAAGEAVFAALEGWLALAPLDPRAHGALLRACARHGRIREGEAHLAAATRLFEAEDLDPGILRDAWRASRAAGGPGAAVPPPAPPEEPARSRRASIAVMPFTGPGPTGDADGGIADGLARDVITRLARLRSLFVIAPGSVFALARRGVGAEEAGRMLDVDYVASGMVRQAGQRLAVSVELVETRSARVVWADRFDRTMDDAFLVLDEIGDRIVAAIASEIESVERNRAMLRPPTSLDAWGLLHRGLWHMYRFSRTDNAAARACFEGALALDPTFSRAHAGLSFTHFQDAFLGWAPRLAAIERAVATAGEALVADDRDPAAHWAMGRALWLRGRQDELVAELERTVDLSPNFALGHYTLAFVHSQSGDADAAVAFSDRSRDLSPFDPMLCAIHGARSMAKVRLGDFTAAAEAGTKAVTRPNAHVHIQAIAAYALSLAGRLDEARAIMAALRREMPAYGIGDFLTAMQLDAHGIALFREAARRIR